ncbi:MAG: zinc-dependent metalloprotease [Actinomycetota bacterium]|nr:zinc-dependent metalloprotease [Actinomycetota bacterium]
MTDLPFGFGNRPDDDPGGSGGAGGEGPVDPFSAMFGAGSASAGMDLGAMFTRLGQVLSWTGGPVNWDLAREVARQTVATSNDRYVGDRQRVQIEEAVRLAELWLDDATVLPAGAQRVVAWSRAEWVEETQPAWKQLVEPVAGRVVEAMGEALNRQAAEIPTELQAMTAPLQGMMRSMGGAMFGAQVGSALGALAGEVVGSTDVGLPLGPAGRAALLPANVATFGAGLGVPEDQVRLYLALREAAHHRLYAHAPWLRERLASEITRYAQGISIDTSRIEEAVSRLDINDPSGLQDAFSSGLFAPQHTPEQERVLARLEGLLALVEGWVDEVVDAAAKPHLPAAGALHEAVRRRRATGGPAEQTFANLVGLQLRPRRLREGAALWAALLEARGAAGRDAVWDHPDYLPDADDLDDPATFAARSRGELDLSELEGAPPAAQEPPDRPDEEGPAGSGGRAGS